MCGCKQKKCNSDCQAEQSKTSCDLTPFGDVVYSGDDVQIADGVYLIKKGKNLNNLITNLESIIQLLNP